MKIQLALAGSTVLYHLIEMEHAITALKNDRFRLAATNEGVEAEFGKKQYFLSLARSKHSDYFKKEMGFAHLVFVLDGQKMNANYQIKAVDYWASQKHVNSDEKEDRLFADKMYIPCIRYVKEIHFMQEKDVKWKTNNSLTLALLAKRNNIPMFQYGDFNDFVNLDKRKTVKLDVSDKKPVKFGTQAPQDNTDGMLKAWVRAAQLVFKEGTPKRTQFMAGAKIKRDENARDRVARTIKDWNRYHEVEKTWVRDFNRLLDYAREGEDLVYLEKIKRLKRAKRLDTKGLLDYIRKRWQE